MGRKTKKRKRDHLEICLHEDTQAKSISTGFEDVFLTHKSLPEVNFEEISLSTKFLEHRFNAPILIDAMTGGFELARKINAALAEAAERLGIGVVTGSQRVALEDKSTVESFRILREKAPTAFVAANIGCQQLRTDNRLEVASRCIEMIDADALTIHLNPLQEVFQLEGDTNFEGCLRDLEEVAQNSPKPVIIKETGGGISGKIAYSLSNSEVQAINVSGVGGTSWAAIEYHRSLGVNRKMLAEAGKTFWDWGIPTAACVYEAARYVDIPIIASGGIRTGLDVAKSLALGANMSAAAFPFLAPALKGSDAVFEQLEKVIYELRAAMFLTGSRDISELKLAEYVVTGRLHQWLKTTGFEP
ncbi:MAG: type 2 isopentenyl-diphosphate Delta-isomerase [Nitrososphaeria archaeon]|nr:type 2 isopentenyl-diphosphate Delta-isomerase [Nitrososphaeria archaeon]NIN52091.1 type 2 isopentenyl-diphosphate Delta-isomerase [Nitrososphaeria archaeon]NIQ32553.1 type 2 isopentenyl-diphosphate Delta-isomerase [Nitrososphaeria archaeon]